MLTPAFKPTPTAAGDAPGESAPGTKEAGLAYPTDGLVSIIALAICVGLPLALGKRGDCIEGSSGSERSCLLATGYMPEAMPLQARIMLNQSQACTNGCLQDV
mmetsp:Transcript_30891/g.56294  ORF Transcript_30891/g.56294 Transcript_30891/m.56294 type:complete len:103 (-) Transcript_30891:31-339(-)